MRGCVCVCWSNSQWGALPARSWNRCVGAYSLPVLTRRYDARRAADDTMLPPKMPRSRRNRLRTCSDSTGAWAADEITLTEDEGHPQSPTHKASSSLTGSPLSRPSLSRPGSRQRPQSVEGHRIAANVLVAVKPAEVGCVTPPCRIVYFNRVLRG